MTFCLSAVAEQVTDFTAVYKNLNSALGAIYVSFKVINAEIVMNIVHFSTAASILFSSTCCALHSATQCIN